MADKDIETKELTLIVKEKTIGSLVTNALEIQNWVKERLSDYSPENYTGNIDDAKKARAELNKAADKLNSERLNLEREFMKPFNEFKDVVKQTTNLINDASNRLDRIVKAKELEEKELRKYELKKLWESKCDYVAFDKILNPKWLNKTAKIDDISCQMKNLLHQIELNLVRLEDLENKDDVEVDKAYYLETLDFNRTMMMRNFREEHRRKEEQPQKKDEPEVKEETPVEAVKDIKYTTIVKKYSLNIIGQSDKIDKIKRIVNNLNIECLSGITIAVTPEQADKLKKQMADMGINYNKCEFLTLDVQ